MKVDISETSELRQYNNVLWKRLHFLMNEKKSLLQAIESNSYSESNTTYQVSSKKENEREPSNLINRNEDKRNISPQSNHTRRGSHRKLRSGTRKLVDIDPFES